VQWIDARQAVAEFEARVPGERVRGSDFQGFELGGWRDETWVLHSMFEEVDPSDARTYDEVHGASTRASLPEGDLGNKLRQILDRPDTVLVGARSGLSGNPGIGWRRVRWGSFLEAAGVDLQGHEHPPSYNWFPFPSWPVSLRSPCEGSMDVDTLRSVFDVLIRHTQGGDDAEAIYFYAGAMFPNVEPRAARARLSELWWVIADHQELTGRAVAPQNMWSLDRSWFTYTDIDLMATKVCGSKLLMDELREAVSLETLDWVAPLATDRPTR
jgi:hypothetical protein